MNIFNTPALIYWQISDIESVCNLEKDDYMHIVKQIQECKPFIVIIVDNANTLNVAIVNNIIRTLKSKGILVKYETNISNLHMIDELNDIVDTLIFSTNQAIHADAISKLLNYQIKTCLNIKFNINSSNINEIPIGMNKLLQIPTIRNITFTHENYSEKIHNNDIDNLLIYIAELEGSHFTKIGYTSYEADIKNLSKNQKIQFDMSIRANGDIALSLPLSIKGGNTKTDNLNEVWSRYLKNFWFSDKIKREFLSFHSLAESSFSHYTDLRNPLSCSDLIREEV